MHEGEREMWGGGRRCSICWSRSPFPKGSGLAICVIDRLLWIDPDEPNAFYLDQSVVIRIADLLKSNAASGWTDLHLDASGFPARCVTLTTLIVKSRKATFLSLCFRVQRIGVPHGSALATFLQTFSRLKIAVFCS